jgi:hypothetical protein
LRNKPAFFEMLQQVEVWDHRAGESHRLKQRDWKCRSRNQHPDLVAILSFRHAWWARPDFPFTAVSVEPRPRGRGSSSPAWL